MNVIPIDSMINIVVSLQEAKLILSAFRALWEKHTKERTMTPRLRDLILTAVVQLDDRITALEEKCPELPQRTYDEIEIEKLNILQP